MTGDKLLLTTDAVGGVWTYSLELARELSRSGLRITLASLGPPPSDLQRRQVGEINGLELVETGLPLDWLAEDAGTLRSASKAVARIAADRESDLVQLHAPALASEGFGVPAISVVHSCVATWWGAVRGTSLPQDFAWRTELAREGMLRSDLLITPTAAFGEAVRETYGLSISPTAVHNGRTATIPAKQAFADFALTVGRLWDEGKNVAAFDRAAGSASIAYRAAGPTSGANGASISLRHAERLGFLTERELASLFAQKPVFVSTARYEPFGLAVLEAAQAGCALVLSDIPTFRELWDGAALFVADDAVASNVDILIANRNRRERLGRAARERAARYTSQANATAMLNLYAAVRGGKRQAA